MIAPVKKFGRVGLCTNFIPNKHGGGEEGELAELAVIWCTRLCWFSIISVIPSLNIQGKVSIAFFIFVSI